MGKNILRFPSTSIVDLNEYINIKKTFGSEKFRKIVIII